MVESHSIRQDKRASNLHNADGWRDSVWCTSECDFNITTSYSTQWLPYYVTCDKRRMVNVAVKQPVLLGHLSAPSAFPDMKPSYGFISILIPGTRPGHERVWMGSYKMLPPIYFLSLTWRSIDVGWSVHVPSTTCLCNSIAFMEFHCIIKFWVNEAK